MLYWIALSVRNVSALPRVLHGVYPGDRWRMARSGSSKGCARVLQVGFAWVEPHTCWNSRSRRSHKSTNEPGGKIINVSGCVIDRKIISMSKNHIMAGSGGFWWKWWGRWKKLTAPIKYLGLRTCPIKICIRMYCTYVSDWVYLCTTHPISPFITSTNLLSNIALKWSHSSKCHFDL